MKLNLYYGIRKLKNNECNSKFVLYKGDKYYGCPDKGWIGYRDSCYLVVEKEADWTEANAYCRKELAELASIENENEQNFLFSQLPKGKIGYYSEEVINVLNVIMIVTNILGLNISKFSYL